MPGDYDVTFGKGDKLLWPVTIKKGETTVLSPGVVQVRGASSRGHKIIDQKGDVVGSVSNSRNRMPLPPGEYTVTFGGGDKLLWPVTVKKGETTVLSPGVIQVKGASSRGHKIFDAKGDVVGSVSNTRSRMPLPPGEYAIELDGKTTSFELAEGQELVFERK